MVSAISTAGKDKAAFACGDFNVAHQEIDIARPGSESDSSATAGYTQAEIDGFSRFLVADFVGTFRHFHPNMVAYGC